MDQAEEDKPTLINSHCDPKIKAAVAAFMEDYNSKNEAKHTIRSCMEAAFKGWLASRGFWPWPPEKSGDKPAGKKGREKAGAA